MSTKQAQAEREAERQAMIEREAQRDAELLQAQLDANKRPVVSEASQKQWLGILDDKASETVRKALKRKISILVGAVQFDFSSYVVSHNEQQAYVIETYEGSLQLVESHSQIFEGDKLILEVSVSSVFDSAHKASQTNNLGAKTAVSHKDTDKKGKKKGYKGKDTFHVAIKPLLSESGKVVWVIDQAFVAVSKTSEGSLIIERHGLSEKQAEAVSGINLGYMAFKYLMTSEAVNKIEINEAKALLMESAK